MPERILELDLIGRHRTGSGQRASACLGIRDDQKFVVEQVFDYYGERLKAFTIDTTGVGFPLWDSLSRHPRFGNRVYGYNFSERVPIGFEAREPPGNATMKNLAIWRNVVQASTAPWRCIATRLTLGGHGDDHLSNGPGE